MFTSSKQQMAYHFSNYPSAALLDPDSHIFETESIIFAI
jgi:hypothetical protein